MENLNKSLGVIQRLKVSIPFSDILNEYIEKKFAALVAAVPYEIKFVSEEPYFIEAEVNSEFPNFAVEMAFKRMQFDVEVFNQLKIWTGASDVTIFGVPEINWKFRAIHDAFHIKHSLGFSYQDELLVNYLQLQEFSFDGLPEFERQLLNIETAGQIWYFHQNGKFPEDQRKFAIGELYKTLNYEVKSPTFFNESLKVWNL